ncbi:hypothetical protein, conserved [Leishmania tarentolae]|uniref:HEAT repeat-containing protein 1 n=1 Tax=Leishmania tarentolae TaxID=5689 RepID=A0A640KJ01_LEITA|nr:hypothetical protein, conserved [Leishmania tarentolae]
MTSQLASQLQRLQQRPDGSQHRLYKSFLFSTQDAQGFSREQIHQLALNGLQTLTAIDNRFHPFIQALFEVKHVRQERSMLTTAEDATLRARLEHFLTLLSPHLFLTAAQQVFEFLVRVYEVHIYDVAAVLRAFLPYHDHNIFARALLLLDLRDTGFDFLVTNQLRGAPLLREHLVLACAESRKAARLVCLTVAMPFRYEIRHHAANALFASVVTQLTTHKDAEALWRTFLPFVLELLSGAVSGAEAGTEESKRAREIDNARSGSSRISTESVATAFVVLASWSAHVRFSKAMLVTLLKPIFRYITAAAFAATGEGHHGAGISYLPVRDLLALLEVVMSTQYHAIADVSVAPLLQTLLALPWRTLASQLSFSEATVMVAGPNGAPTISPRHSALLATLLQTALERLSSVSEVRLLPSDVVEFLTCAAEDLPLSNSMVTRFLRVLMTAEAGASSAGAVGDTPAQTAGENNKSLYHRLATALERRYAVVFDGVLSEVLLHPETTAAAAAFLARHFRGTRYGMVEVGSTLSGATETLPLFACLLHPVPEVRALAAKTLQGMSTTQLMSDASATNGSGQSLVDLLAHIITYEHNCTAAEAFVTTAAAVMMRLTDQWSSEKPMGCDELGCRTACQLVRSLYSMVLRWSPSVASAASAGVATRTEAQRRVVLPLVTTVFRPAILTWTRGTGAMTSAVQEVRTSVLYHATLLYAQWTGTPSLTIPISEEDADLAAQVSTELLATLEAGCGGPDTLAPLFCSRSVSGKGQNKETARNSKSGKTQRQRVGRCGVAAAEHDSDDEKEHQRLQVGSSGCTRDNEAGTCIASFTDLIQCDALLDAIRAEAQRRLPDAFSAACTAARESATILSSASPCEMEVAIALATALLPTVGTHAPASVLDTVSATLTFLHGDAAASETDIASSATTAAATTGYLDTVYATLLDNSGRRGVTQVGRGTVDAATAACEQLYKVPLITQVGVVLRAALTRVLASAATAAVSSVSSWASLVLQLCKCLGFVGASLPSIATQPDVLAPAYLELISSMTAVTTTAEATSGAAAALRQVDWYALVADAVFGSAEREVSHALDAKPRTFSALALVLFLPLRAPSTQRLTQLRALQDAVVTAGAQHSGASGRPSGLTGVQVILSAAMQLQQGTSSSTSSACSVTALSCLIECMAVEERQYQLTPSAAALVCLLLTIKNGTDNGAQGYIVPDGWAHRVIRYFFRSHNSHSLERVRAGSSSAAAAAAPLSTDMTPQQLCLIEAMLPRVEGILTSTENADASSPSSSTRTVTADAADLVDAVCGRLNLWGTTSAKEETVAGNASVRLVELLLKHPYVHVHHSGGARPVYRYALGALAVGLSYGLEDRRSMQSTIFKSRKSVSTATSRKGEYAMSAEYQRLVAARLQPVVLHALDVIGTNVALMCMRTLGGYEYFFLPLVASVESAMTTVSGRQPVTSKAKAARNRSSQSVNTDQEAASEAVAVLLKHVQEMLETLAPSPDVSADETPSTKHNEGTGRSAEGQDGAAYASEVRWQPPSSAAAANPLTFADAQRVLRLPSVCTAAARGTGKWPLGALSRESLRLLRTLLCVLPTVVIDEEEDNESVYALVMECVELYPLRGMEVLLRQAASSAAADDVAMLPRVQQLRLGARGSVQVEGVLRFVEALVHVCTNHTRLLSEKVTDGAHRITSLLLREMMVLMAHVLVDDHTEDVGAEKDDEAPAASSRHAEVDTDTAELRQSELHFHIDTISGLLRATAPLLKAPTATAAAAATTRTNMAENSTYLHIPLVSLLIKLEPFDNTEALGFRSAREVCQEILSSFDIRTQVQCLGKLMRLVADPAAQLSTHANAVEEDGAVDGEEQQRVQHLFRRLVKPNQVINRQEAILHLVNLTVKSDLFLEPFLALQRYARSSQPSRAAERRRLQKQRGKRSAVGNGADRKESDADEDAEEQAEGAVQREDGGCMELLVSALELFAHYHDLHETTRSGTASGSSDGEAEAYTSLLELLAGNTLACVLAGINEPTFVVCQQRLLEDKRAALRKIGLEVLLDRLHHSLPTLENVVSDEEMEAHRRRLRDPQQRLSLVDLVRIKARPLTTKRSIQLFPLLVAEIKSSLAQFHAATQSANAADELLTTAHLGIAAVEELIRIVSSGGSLQSEKTLLNANRSKRVTEAALVKLFGNRSRVDAVHELVDLICNHWMPLLTRCEMRLRSRAERSGGDGVASHSSATSHARAEESVLGCMTCLVTALATIVQVMGTAFASTHCLELLHTLVSAGVYQVLEMPGVISRSEAGALLRHATLSSLIRCFPACWQMTQPYLPSMLFFATHLRNVTDAESHYLCAEMLAVLEAVIEPQLLLEAGTTCLQGLPYLNGAVVPASEQHQLADLAAEGAAPPSQPRKAKKATVRVRQIRAQVPTHSFSLLFTCFERRVENLSKEELMHVRTLTEGTTPQQNFWLAAFQSLASAPSVPSSESVMPVLQAFTVFLLKFKAKHSVRLLRIVADWAFAESSGGVAGASRKCTVGPSDSDNEAEDEHNGRGHDGAAQSISRVTLQSWIVFFALSNHLLGKLGSILDFAFPTLLPHVVTALRTYCATTATASKAMDSLVALALEGALECMRNIALAQTPGPDHDYRIEVDVYFAKPDVFPSVMPALVHQLHNLHYLEDGQHDYRFRVEHNVIPAIRAFMACLGSSKLQSKTQAELVRALRHPSRHVRREALICLDGIYADGGDELASRLMAEMLPTVVELTEDRDDAVVEEARKLCNNLSHMTGQDVLYAMS